MYVKCGRCGKAMTLKMRHIEASLGETGVIKCENCQAVWVLGAYKLPPWKPKKPWDKWGREVDRTEKALDCKMQDRAYNE